MKYKDLPLSEEMQKALEIAGYETPTEIQEKSIPLSLEGKDIIGQAQTGTGKTAAFAIPIIENTDINNKDIQHLILAPTRELAVQIMNEVNVLGKVKGINAVQLIGGISYDRQWQQLKTKPQIIVGTPGRIKDYLDKGKLKVHNVKSFTLDEVDQLLSIGFQKDIETINKTMPKTKQMFFFSATFGKKVTTLAKKMLNNPVEVKVSSGLSSTKTVKQEWIIAKAHQKFNIFKLFLQIHKPVGAIVFCRTRRGVEKLVQDLKAEGYKVEGIQGDMEQSKRSRVIKAFREEKFNIVIGTDVLARGIDVGHADYVYNYDLPEELENYTHRIGRVGRAGKEGKALTFVVPSQVGYMKRILRETDSRDAKEIELPEQGVLDKIFVRQRTHLLTQLLERTNKHDLEDYVKENYSADEMAKMISVILKKEVKSFKVEELLKGDGGRSYGGGGGNRSGDRRRSGGGNRGGNRGGGNRGGNRSGGNRGGGNRGRSEGGYRGGNSGGNRSGGNRGGRSNGGSRD
ncbi:MAG: DEAD/DEAH box helicase [Mycoplasmataceae bacterium]|nr:DEAD/DEAH box helicase [Mycoplasmataceae bacterium]